MRALTPLVIALCLVGAAASEPSLAAGCDKACLEDIAVKYRTAWRLHDVALAPFARKLRYTENNVEMGFPDGSWDTITTEVGSPLVLSDPETGQVGFYTTIMQGPTPTFAAVRLKVSNGAITEIEHILSTRRNLSSPPTPIGDIWNNPRDPDFTRVVPVEQRASRELLKEQADGYFSTLQFNNGEIRGARFAPDATRNENGLQFTEIEAAFKTGRYRFNNRVRDRDCMLVDEERSAVMCRMFIDHKGVLGDYTLADGSVVKSVFREPQTWSALESFKVKNGQITAVEATFTAAPYFIRSPFTKKPDAAYDALKE